MKLALDFLGCALHIFSTCFTKLKFQIEKVELISYEFSIEIWSIFGLFLANFTKVYLLRAKFLTNFSGFFVDEHV